MPNCLAQPILNHFQAFLHEAKLSRISVKNYVSDVRLFLQSQDIKNAYQITGQKLDQYLSLIAESKPQASYRRYLASLRRFVTFLAVEYRLNIPLKSSIDDQSGGVQPPKSTPNILIRFQSFLQKEKKSSATIKNYLSDVNHFFSWTAKQTREVPNTSLSEIFSTRTVNTYFHHLRLSKTSTSVLNRRGSSIRKLVQFGLDERLISHNPFARNLPLPILAPLVYAGSEPAGDSRFGTCINNPLKTEQKQRYHPPPFIPYLHLGLLILFTIALGIFGYFQIIKQASKGQAYPAAPIVPSRILSFQGRLTDKDGGPITTNTSVIFRLWNQATEGTALYTTNACQITPSGDGNFSALIGHEDCGSKISSSLFSENQSIFLEMTVGGQTLTPRTPIASAGYALNSETLQGYPASASAVENTIPLVNNNGQIILGSTSPSIVSTSGTFALKGQALTLVTEIGSDGDISLAPDGRGSVSLIGGVDKGVFVNVTDANLTTGTLIEGYVGNNTASGTLLHLASGVKPINRLTVSTKGQTDIIAETYKNAAFSINQTGQGPVFLTKRGKTVLTSFDRFGNISSVGGLSLGNGAYYTNNLPGQLLINADTKGQAAVIINQNSAWGDILTASRSGQTYLVLSREGNLGLGDPTPGAKLVVAGKTKTSKLMISEGAVNGYILITDAEGNASWQSASDIGIDDWQRANGSLAPINISDSINIGAVATASAFVHLAGTSGENSFINTGNVGIGTTGPTSTLTVNNGSDATAPLILQDNGTAVFTFADVTGTVVNGFTLTPSIADGTNLIAATGSDTNIALSIDSKGSDALNLNGTATGDVNIAGGSSSTGCTVNNTTGTLTCTGDITGASTGTQGYWQRASGGLAPVNISDSINIGAVATGSAFVHLAGTSGENSFINTGNVGIGTTSPGGKLDITDISDTAASLTLTNNTATTIGAGTDTLGVTDIQSTSLTTGNLVNLEANSLTSGKILNLSSTSTGLTTGSLLSVTASGNPGATWTGSLGLFEYTTSIDADIDGSALKVGITGASTGEGTALNITTNQNVITALALRVNDDGTYTDPTPFVVDVTGNVGIGKTLPAGKLEISGAVTGKALAMFNETGDQALLVASASGINKFIITNSGAVGIGTTGPTSTLTVNNGSNATAPLILQDNGTAVFTFADVTGTVVNGFTLTPSIADGTNLIAATGSDTNIALSIDSKGSDVLNLNGTATGDVNIAGGSGSTGCTVTNSDGSLACTGNITGPSTGTVGYWTRSGTTLWPTTNTDNVTTLGSVGIGTTSPGGTLSIVSGNVSGLTTSSALNLSANSLTTGTGLYAASSTLSSGKLVDLQVSGTAAAASQTVLNISTAGTNGIDSTTTYGAQISNTHTTATEFGTNVALYLNASGATTNYGLIVNAGNVGIGTAAPGAKLQVEDANISGAGGANVSIYSNDAFAIDKGGTLGLGGKFNAAGFSANFASISGRKATSTDGDASGYLSIAVQHPTSAMTEFMRINSSGNVGIGTTNPTSELHIAGTTPQITIGDTGAEDTSIVFDGNAQDYHVGLDDTNDTFEIGLGATLGTTPYLNITSTGLVGIGTTSPGGTLSIVSGNVSGLTTSSALNLSANSLTTGTGLYAASSTLSSGKLVDLQVSGTAAAASQTALNILTAGANGTAAITTYGAQISNTHTNATSGTNVALYLNASGATTANYGLIVNAGNVGIGTTNPTSELHIAGTTPQITIGDTGAEDTSIVFDGNAQDYHVGLDDTNDTFEIGLGATLGTTPYLNITSTGLVGIGTAAPTSPYKLHILGSSGAVAQLIQNNTAGTGNYAQLSILSDTVTTNLHSLSSTFTTSAQNFASGATLITNGSGGLSIAASDAGGDIRFYTGGTTNIDMFVKDDGNVGIGTTNPGAQLDLSTDSARKLTTTTWATGSDVRIKTSIQSIDNALEVIREIRPVKYHYTPEYMSAHPSIKDTDYYNFIAQEYQQVFPNSVTETDGLLYLNSSNMIPYAIAGIKTLDKEIASLSAQIADLTLTSTGNLQISGDASDNYLIHNIADQTIVDRIGVFAEAMIANLRAGIIESDKLISPVAEIDTLRIKSKLLSPLADIDTIYSSTVSAQTIIAKDASVSGLTRLNEVTAVTLYATEINSPTIDLLDTKYQILSTDYATASAILAAIKAKYGSFDSLTNPSVNDNPLNTDGLTTANATVAGEYVLMNQPVIIADNILVNSTLISNSLNSNEGTLYLQPTASAPINLLAGLMTLTPDGKVNINGDLSVNGNIAAKTLSVAEGLTTNQATISGSFTSNTASISGSIASNEIITNGLLIASAASESATATSSAALSTNASIGTAIITAGSTEISIANTNIRNGTYVYLTPISDTNNQVLYVKTKQEGAGFTIGISQPLTVDLKFNYWLIQTQP